jgi:hypothetical protein
VGRDMPCYSLHFDLDMTFFIFFFFRTSTDTYAKTGEPQMWPRLYHQNRPRNPTHSPLPTSKSRWGLAGWQVNTHIHTHTWQFDDNTSHLNQSTSQPAKQRRTCQAETPVYSHLRLALLACVLGHHAPPPPSPTHHNLSAPSARKQQTVSRNLLIITSRIRI